MMKTGRSACSHHKSSMSAGVSASVPAADAALLLRVLSTAAAREARTHARSAPWGSKLAVWRGQVVAWMRDVRGVRLGVSGVLEASVCAARAFRSFHSSPALRTSPLLQLAAEFKFDPETVAIAVSFFDRVLSAIQIPSKVFQTAALACMYIGAAGGFVTPFSAPSHTPHLPLSLPLCGSQLPKCMSASR